MTLPLQKEWHCPCKKVHFIAHAVKKNSSCNMKGCNAVKNMHMQEASSNDYAPDLGPSSTNQDTPSLQAGQTGLQAVQAGS